MIRIKLDDYKNSIYLFYRETNYWPSLTCQFKVSDDGESHPCMPEFIIPIEKDELDKDIFSDEDIDTAYLFGCSPLFLIDGPIDGPKEKGLYLDIMELKDLIKFRDYLNKIIDKKIKR